MCGPNSTLDALRVPHVELSYATTTLKSLEKNTAIAMRKARQNHHRISLGLAATSREWRSAEQDS
jgi:hypothetical protein